MGTRRCLGGPCRASSGVLMRLWHYCTLRGRWAACFAPPRRPGPSGCSLLGGGGGGNRKGGLGVFGFGDRRRGRAMTVGKVRGGGGKRGGGIKEKKGPLKEGKVGSASCSVIQHHPRISCSSFVPRHQAQPPSPPPGRTTASLDQVLGPVALVKDDEALALTVFALKPLDYLH